MVLNIPTHEVKGIMSLLAMKWTGPGKVIGCFKPIRDQVKLTIRMANKGEVAMVTTKALATYTLHHGHKFNHHLITVSMVLPGMWTLTLEDAELTGKLCSLYKVVLYRRELIIGPWKESFKQSYHQAYLSGLAETTLRHSIIEFFHQWCGEVMAVSIAKPKTYEEREANLKHQSGTKARQATRTAAKQACQQYTVDKRLSNVAAMAKYSQNALLHTHNFTSGM